MLACDSWRQIRSRVPADGPRGSIRVPGVGSGSASASSSGMACEAAGARTLPGTPWVPAPRAWLPATVWHSCSRDLDGQPFCVNLPFYLSAFTKKSVFTRLFWLLGFERTHSFFFIIQAMKTQCLFHLS